MPQDTRKIRRLVLNSPAAAVARAAFLVEDGLRTATLQGSERRLVIVRSIALGAIDVRESPVALSLRIERKWAEAARFAVPAEAEASAFAPAVTFPSIEYAFARWLAEVVQGRRPTGWFWRRIVPGSIQTLPATEALTALAHEVAKTPSGAPLRVFDLIEEVARLGALRVLVSMLEDRNVQPVLDLLIPGFTPPPLSVKGLKRASIIDLPQPYRDVFVQRVLIRAVVDRVAFFVALAGTVSARPWLLGSANALITEVDRRIEAAAFTITADSADTRPEEPHGAVSSPNVQPAQAVNGSMVAPATPITGATGDSVEIASPTAAPDQPRASAEAFVAPEQSTTHESPELTGYAGLFFVLPVLFRTGFPGFIDQHPDLFDKGLLPELLRAIATASGSQPGDPSIRALGLDEPLDDEELHQAITRWRRIAQRYVRREAKMLLINLVRRPGRILYTRTHIDIFFELHQADLRIRQLGLDVDPGWVPELGKVVAYHYGCDRY